MARPIRFDLITNYNPRGVRAAHRDFGGLQNKLTHLSGKFRSAFKSMSEGAKEFNATFAGLKHVWELVKIPVMIIGAKLLTSALTSAAAGAASFVSAIAPASGAVAALPQAFLGIAATLGVVKLATSGMGDALKALGQKGPGSAEKVKKAMAGLPAPTRAFVRELNKLRPELAKLKTIAATPIMAGFHDGLQAVKPLLPLVRDGVKQTATEIGRFVSGAAGVARTALFQRAAASVLKTNTIALHSMGAAGINLARSFLYVTRDAQPLVRWLIQLAAGAGNTAAAFLKAEAKSGGLRRFFADSRTSISRLVRLFSNLAVILVTVFGQGKRLGDSLLVSLVKLTAKWREFVTSGKGRKTIADVFKQAKAPIIEAAKLLGGLVKLIAGLGQSESLAPIIAQIRTELLPSIVNLSGAFDSIAPIIVDALVKLGRLFSAIIAQDGGLTKIVGIIGKLAGAFATLLEQHPQLANFASALTILAPSITAIKFVAMVTGIRAISKALVGGRTAVEAFSAGIRAIKYATSLARVELGLLRVQTIAVAVGQKVAAAATVVWAAVVRILNVALTANPIGLVITAIALLVAAFILAYKKSDTFRRIVNASFRVVVAVARFLRDRIVEHFRTIVDRWVAAAKIVIFLRDRAVAAFRTVVSAAQNMGRWIARVSRDIAKWVDTIVRFIGGLAVRAYRALFNFPVLLGRRAREAWDAFLAKAKERWEAIKKWASGIPASFAAAMGDLGKALINKFSGAVKKVLEFLGLKKDSGIFAQIGRMMVDEIALGIADRMKKIPNLLSKLGGFAGAGIGGLLGGFSYSGPAGNYVALGKAMAAAVGWTGAQWNALFRLWQGESGWNPAALNKSSGAFGIPQALPAGKMGTAALSGPLMSMARAQIAWGLGYIKSVYGSPLNAFSKWLARSPHWYHQGGPIFEDIVGFGRSGRTYGFQRGERVVARGRDVWSGAITVDARLIINGPMSNDLLARMEGIAAKHANAVGEAIIRGVTKRGSGR